ncbi:hypothetical protein MMG00_08905 [Ignatzschineria rhizosphaerae]|uniref:Uncharacterized protein n=1 Tax=Ignatzschineria rhizosphaerae TaxID=2923279 RepID=A0ABY3WXK9_9GAMM|nr:hypothetical protein [Ignatzschineria rhizosphaerae]UNM95348.1 hypothetical protein MMG00_08905 [Ignatzschineria rhizosphaerae]
MPTATVVPALAVGNKAYEDNGIIKYFGTVNIDYCWYYDRGFDVIFIDHHES